MLSIYPTKNELTEVVLEIHTEDTGGIVMLPCLIFIYYHEAVPLLTQGPVVREQCWKLMAKYEAWTEQKLRKETRKDFKVQSRPGTWKLGM